jgi:two-component system phosphate regulon sensor histidine kinase PhoR
MFEKHQVELKEETIDLAVLVKEVVNSMKLQFEKYKAQVNLQLTGYHFEVEADRLHITSVLFNLLDNALKYSRENPSIHIELKDDNDRITLHVTDNGIGIAPEYHRKIFDKFFRVPAGNTHNVKGYGLGLSYVAYVIQRHAGSIDVESKPGIGSRFIIKLPAAS